MQKRKIGNTERALPTIGLGCMGLSEFYGPPMEQTAAIKLLHEAIELGVEHFDTAEMYGIGCANETLLGKAFTDRRDRVFIATKFWPTRDFKTGQFSRPLRPMNPTLSMANDLMHSDSKMVFMINFH